MSNGYQNPKKAQIYEDFLASTNGQIQREILTKALLSALPSSPQTAILDAASGNGWLAADLKNIYDKVYGCDGSAALISSARQRYKAVEFSHCDLCGDLPYPAGFFDAVILNMAAPDIEDLNTAVKNLTGKLKFGGKFLMTIPNPYYSYPVAVWKRSLIDVLLFRKPQLKINRSYFGPKEIQREFNGKKIDSHFYTMSDYLGPAGNAGLGLTKIHELKSQTDGKQFDLNYEMYRFPLILMLEFKK